MQNRQKNKKSIEKKYIYVIMYITIVMNIMESQAVQVVMVIIPAITQVVRMFIIHLKMNQKHQNPPQMPNEV